MRGFYLLYLQLAVCVVCIYVLVLTFLSYCMLHKCRHLLWQSDSTICLWTKPAREPGMICGAGVDCMSFRSLLKQAEQHLIYCCKQQKSIVLTAANIWRGYLLQDVIWNVLYLLAGFAGKGSSITAWFCCAVILSVFLLNCVVAWPKHLENTLCKIKCWI